MNGNRRRPTNTIEVNFLARWLVAVFFIGLAGLFFVYLKNQQHAVGDQARQIESALSEIEAKNDALKARITAMTSRSALQRRVDEGYIRLEPIRDTAIARITPAQPAESEGVLRTASSDPDGRFGAGVPLRAVSR
jgi:cell division protein FtsB